MAREKKPQGTGKCSVCDCDISLFALNCREHRVQEKQNQWKKGKVDPKWLVRGDLSYSTGSSMISNGA